MKENIVDIIKNLIISSFIVICILIVASLVFYDKIALNKVIPETETYYLSEEMEKEIEKTNLDETEEVVVTYSIDATDLRKYEKNNQYVKGKSHPFAATSDYTASNSTTTSSSSSSSSGFYEDDGTK